MYFMCLYMHMYVYMYFCIYKHSVGICVKIERKSKCTTFHTNHCALKYELSLQHIKYFIWLRGPAVTEFGLFYSHREKKLAVNK